jgi:hypothetical protein
MTPSRCAPKDSSSTPIFDLPEDEPLPDLWSEVTDLERDDIAVESAEAEEESDVWEATRDVQADDLTLELSSDEEAPPQLWGPLTGAPPPVLGERLPALPALPEPRGVRALVTGSSPEQLPSPRETLPWRGRFVAEEFPQQPLIYTVALEGLRTELAVVDWQWSDEPEETSRTVTIRLEDDGATLSLPTTESNQPVVSLRGFLGRRELRFDALLVSGRTRRGLLVGRDVLSEGYLVDPATDATEKD